MIRCTDNSLYTGITTDIKRRFKEHKNQNKLSAKYTKTRQVISIEALWMCDSRSTASKLEYTIKKLKKQEKEALISDQSNNLDFINDFDKIYKRIETTDYAF